MTAANPQPAMHLQLQVEAVPLMHTVGTTTSIILSPGEAKATQVMPQATCDANSCHMTGV